MLLELNAISAFLWLWEEEYVSNPGTADVLMADISSQVGWILIPDHFQTTQPHCPYHTWEASSVFIWW